MGLTQHSTGTDIVASLLNLLLACGMIGRWGAAMIPIRGQNNVQGASDVGAIPFAYTDYRPVTDPAIRHLFASTGVPAGASAAGRTQGDADRQRPVACRACTSWAGAILSDPEVSHAEHWFRTGFLAVQTCSCRDGATRT